MVTNERKYHLTTQVAKSMKSDSQKMLPTHDTTLAQVKTSRVPREQRPYFLTGRNKRKAWFFVRFAIPKFFYRLVMNKRKRHV
jgi:hypothetical protein